MNFVNVFEFDFFIIVFIVDLLLRNCVFKNSCKYHLIVGYLMNGD